MCRVSFRHLSSIPLTRASLQPRGYKAIAKEQGQTSEDMSARSFNKFSKAKGFKEPAIVDFGFVSYSVMSQQGLHASVDFALTDHRLLANLSPPHLHTFTLSRLHGGNQMHEILSFRREHLHMVNTSSELFKFTFKAIKALDCVKCESHAPSDSGEPQWCCCLANSTDRGDNRRSGHRITRTFASSDGSARHYLQRLGNGASKDPDPQTFVSHSAARDDPGVIVS